MFPSRFNVSSCIYYSFYAVVIRIIQMFHLHHTYQDAMHAAAQQTWNIMRSYIIY